MYKLEPSLIKFKVKIEKSDKILTLQKPGKTRLREISIIICKLLTLDRFDTDIAYNIDQFAHKISETTTIRQIHLKKKNFTLRANIRATPAPSQYETRVPYYKDKKVKMNVFGLHYINEDAKKEKTDQLVMNKMKKLRSNFLN